MLANFLSFGNGNVTSSTANQLFLPGGWPESRTEVELGPSGGWPGGGTKGAGLGAGDVGPKGVVKDRTPLDVGQVAGGEPEPIWGLALMIGQSGGWAGGRGVDGTRDRNQ